MSYSNKSFPASNMLLLNVDFASFLRGERNEKRNGTTGMSIFQLFLKHKTTLHCILDYRETLFTSTRLVAAATKPEGNGRDEEVLARKISRARGRQQGGPCVGFLCKSCDDVNTSGRANVEEFYLTVFVHHNPSQSFSVLTIFFPCWFAIVLLVFLLT